ncbi:MAG TPA: hypothetical protein VFW07_18540 [Parafilimonas sp.]|nr:hypothetical protein [Parafilimonas sp.]
MKRGLFILFAFLLSCNKNDVTVTSAHTKATVIDAGVNIDDGCGWLIALDEGGTYHPDNLPSTVQQNNLQVWIDYASTRDTFYCGIASTPYPVIKVINISPR